MIPKMIHYCWFGGNPIPKRFKEYMKSWKRFCPDYEIVEWNEHNFDISANEYCKEAYTAGKWAFVSDFARLKIIYEHGGIYLDTDVELVKSLQPLLHDDIGFIGFQNSEEINSGLGFAAASGNVCVKQMLNTYQTRHFLQKTGSYDLTPCPVANTSALLRCGLKTGRKASEAIQELEGMRVLPVNYLNPLNLNRNVLRITDETYAIHHYAASWRGDEINIARQIKKCVSRIGWGGLLDKRDLFISRRDIREFIHNNP